MTRLLLLVATLAALVCGCEGVPDLTSRPADRSTTANVAGGAPGTAASATSNTSATSAPASQTESPAPMARKPIECPPTSPGQCLAQATSHLALELYAELRRERQDVVLSPASIALALAMAEAGARGPTAAELRRALSLDRVAPERVDPGLKALVGGWRKPRPGVTLTVANRLFGDEALEFERAYLQRLARSFEAPLERVDFAGSPEPARDRVNAWVDGQTHGRVPELLPKDGIDAETRVVLANAAYLSARWKLPFEPAKTTPETFHEPDGGTRLVPMMKKLVPLPFAAYEQEHLSVLRLPYEGDELEMVVLLPDTADGLPELDRRLSPAAIERWVSGTRRASLDLWLPRFRLAPGLLRLKQPLQTLGMRQAFDSAHADFSGIAPVQPSGPRIHLQELFHHSIVHVTETGTEAAAASAVASGFGSGHGRLTKVVHVDRPFLVLIRDATTGALLLLGRVSHPEAG